MKKEVKEGVKEGEVKAFKHMPGPKPWPLLGTLPYYWKGEHSWSDLLHTGQLKHQQFGDTVREQVLPGVEVVWLFHPRDIRAMYAAEGETPSRRSHMALKHLRESRPGTYRTPGLFPTNGKEWQRIRRPLQVVEWVGEHREELEAGDLLPQLEKIFMEVTGQVVLGRRLGSLQLHLPPSSLPARLIAAARRVNSAVLGTDNGLPVWRLAATQGWRATEQGMAVLAEVAEEVVA